jgi:hypothetical protein
MSIREDHTFLCQVIDMGSSDFALHIKCSNVTDAQVISKDVDDIGLLFLLINFRTCEKQDANQVAKKELNSHRFIF